MEPFVIQCTTCRARLKVSDPALVGDIVGCPKCESFVQVTPPPGWQPPAPSAAAVVATTVPATAIPATGAPNAGVAAGSSGSGTIPLQPARNAGAKTAKQPAARGAATAPFAPPPLPSGASQSGAPSSASLASTSLSSSGRAAAAVAAAGKSAPAAARVASGTSSLIVPEPPSEPGALAQLMTAAGQHYWISAGSLASLTALVAIAWLVFGTKAGVSPATDSQSSELALGSDTEQHAADRGVDDPGDKRSSDKDSSAKHQSAADDSTSAATGDAQRGKANDGSANSHDPADGGERADASAEPTDTNTQAGAALDMAAPTARHKGDALDPIARALATEPEPLLSSNPGAAPTDLPDGLSPGAAAASKGVATSSSAGNKDDAASEESETAAHAALVAHLQDKVPAGEFKGIPLMQFVAFLSDFSTVPITIDAESLQQAGKDPKTKVTVKLTGETVEAALRAALAKPGLTFRVEPKRLVIVAGAAKP